MEESATSMIAAPAEDWRDESLAVWEVIVLALILTTTLMGNVLVLFAIYLKRCRGRRQRLTRMHFFVMHLSVADLITGLFNVLPQLAWDVTFSWSSNTTKLHLTYRRLRLELEKAIFCFYDHLKWTLLYQGT
ncbi:hypothetical protein TSAR_010824 [Trichomalopsis sarcophagae]|uniref:G-protein coupled receptors family 1 profile domain-containing protein n=1 Tax=Trichomalopsis sarcophagae TaxID=543379 RepID=A0A232EZS2_9HYME|nr:hypothetical protein TSAR_010824 [Trichomalopsis sarcophagae]